MCRRKDNINVICRRCLVTCRHLVKIHNMVAVSRPVCLNISNYRLLCYAFHLPCRCLFYWSCLLDTNCNLVGKVEKRARKPWIKQEMITKMGERRKWKNVNNEEGRRNYRRLRNELIRAIEMAKKEYLENICNEIMEFKRTGRYDLMYMKTKELGWRDPRDSRYWHRRLPGEQNN